jgi:PTH1 family peptidyl-tRNA hydrolase
MLLVVGLGNPGRAYANNRHNVGFMAVDAIARRHRFAAFRQRFQGIIAEGLVAGQRVLALKPMTFMNESGRAVAAATGYLRIPAGDVLVVHDEIDLRAGKIRTKHGGGHAGHNGLRSIHAHIGPDYRRLRLGIGHPGERERVVGHVLDDFSKADEAWLGPLLEAVAEWFPLLVEGDEARFLNKAALALQPSLPEAGRAPGQEDPRRPEGGDGT